jgi:putative transposase
MPRKPKLRKPPAEVLAPIPAEVLDQIVRDGPLTAEEIERASRRFKKALIERALGGELTHHLGYPLGAAKPERARNHRNGTSGKTVLTDDGPVSIEVPRDREGTFAPQLIGKHERRFTGFDDKVIALYARGLTVRESQAFLKEAYAVEVSPDLAPGHESVRDSVRRSVSSTHDVKCNRAWTPPSINKLYTQNFGHCLVRSFRDTPSNQKLKTRKLKPRTKNQKPKTKNQKPKTETN